MAIDQSRVPIIYSRDGVALRMPPRPIVTNRDPGTEDSAQIGALWVNTTDQSVWCLVSTSNGTNTWTTSPASGVGSFTSVTVNPGDIDVTAGDVTITAGNLDVTAGNATIGGDLTVTGTTTIAGDFDLSSAALIDLTSTLNADPAILLLAAGGAAATVELRNSMGTAVDALQFNSTVGGITLSAGLASADAINITAGAGGVDIDGALQVNIASSQNANDAVVINASAGGVNITATGAAGEDIDIINTNGSLNFSVGEAIADSVVLATAGGIDINCSGAFDIDVTTAGSMNFTPSESAADAFVVNASGAAGGIQLQAGSSGILIGNQADCAVIDLGDVVPASARTITVSGGTVATAIADTLDLAPDGVDTDAGASKVVNINSGNVTLGTGTTNIASGNRVSGTHTANLSTGTGTKTVNVGNADGLTTVNIDAITLINDSINVNTSINTGTSTGTVSIGNAAAGAIALDSGAGISLDGAAASNFSVSGAGIDLTLASSGGRVVVDGAEAAADGVRITASDAAGGIDIDSGTGGIAVDSTGGISLDAAAASNFTATGAFDITLSSTAGSMIIDGGEAAADAVQITASDAAGGVAVSAGTGGIALSAAGAVSMVPATNSAAGTSLTLNGRVGVATFTGQTTASGADIDLTITNSSVTQGCGIFVTVSNIGTNDADIQLEGAITQTAGTLTLHCINQGPAALNGDIIVTFWIIN